MNTKLKDHNVEFYKQNSPDGKIVFFARGGGLANFLDTYTDVDSIIDGLANVDYYLNGGIFDYEKNTLASELYTAWLDNNSADIYPNTGDTEILLQSIPLQDFKTILQQWLDFLKS